MTELKREADALRGELLALGRRDSEAFEAVLRGAAAAPGHPAELPAREAAMAAADLASRPGAARDRAGVRRGWWRWPPRPPGPGNVNAVSDAGVAGLLARAAGEGALLNVQINLKSLAPNPPIRRLWQPTSRGTRTELAAVCWAMPGSRRGRDERVNRDSSLADA